MSKRLALAFAATLAATALAVPAAEARPIVCTYVPDLEGNLYGPVCISTP